MIYIDLMHLNECIQFMNQHRPLTIKNEVQRMQSIFSYDLDMASALGTIAYYANSLSTRYHSMLQHLVASNAIYESLETQLQKEAGVTNISNTWNYTNYLHTSTYTHNSLSNQKSLYSYWKNGICAGASVAFSAVDHQTRYQSQYVNANGSLDLLQAKTSIDGELLFTKDGKSFMPALNINAKGSVSILQTSGSLTIGTQNIYVSASGNLGIGVTYAEGKAVLNSEEITFKGKIGASAIEVSGKGSVNVFGVSVSVTASANLGSVGAGAEFSAKTGELSFGANASLLAGVGVHVDIDY